MGNSESEPDKPNAMKIFHDYEHKDGKLIVAAIKSNSISALDAALEVARKEFARPKTLGANKAQYDDMVIKMLEYVTQKYDVGEGIFNRQTPLELAKTCKAAEAEKWILTKTEYFEKLKNSGLTIDDGSTSNKTSSSSSSNNSSSNSGGGGGTEDPKERAALAKERLKAYRNAK